MDNIPAMSRLYFAEFFLNYKYFPPKRIHVYIRVYKLNICTSSKDKLLAKT